MSRFGFPPGRPVDYLTWVQLKLNEDRVDRQRANALAMGHNLATSSENIDMDWADAVAIDPAEAEEILFQANKERAAARRKAKGGGIPGVG